jgi:hypothetical protein
VRAGVTGHRHLEQGASRIWLANTFARRLDELRVTEGVSALAEGADQIFAEVILATARTLVAVVPFEGYEWTFESDEARATYARQLQRASRRIELRHPGPHEHAYLEAGRAVIERCDLLFAVWDGKPARGLGGTADAVQLARDAGRRILQLDPIARTELAV